MLLIALLLGFVLGRISVPVSQKNPGVIDGAVVEETKRAGPTASLAGDPPTRRPDTATTDVPVARRPTTTPIMLGKKGAESSSDSEGGQEPEPSVVGTDPEELLATIVQALEVGDSEALVEIAAAVESQKEFLVPELLALLENADSLFAKAFLARLLGVTKDPDALLPLQELLEDEDHDQVRTAAITALGEIPDESSVSLLIAELSRENDSPLPSSLAAASLGKIGSPQAIEALKRQIQQGANEMVRAFAMGALSQLKDPALVPFFLDEARRTEVRSRVRGQEIISEVSEGYRRQAVYAIVETGDADAIPFLEELVLSSNAPQSVKESAKRAINKLAGRALYDIR